MPSAGRLLLRARRRRERLLLVVDDQQPEVRQQRVLQVEATVEHEQVLLRIEVECGKGYYVRSLARDLGERLAVPAHLGALRRTRSGPFVIAEAAPLDADPEALARAIIPLAEAASRSLATARLTESGAAKAAVGKRLTALDFTLAPPSIAPCAWLDANGSLIAIGQSDAAGEASVIRGFNDDDG